MLLARCSDIVEVMCCLAIRIQSLGMKSNKVNYSFSWLQLAYLPDRKRDHLIDDDSGSHASEPSVEGKDDVINLDELMKDYKRNKRRGMLGWFKMRVSYFFFQFIWM